MKLHKELEVFLETEGPFSPRLRHPMVYATPYFPEFNAMYNELLFTRKTEYEEALEDMDWYTCIQVHEPECRLAAFQRLAIHLPDEDYWTLLGEVWRDNSARVHQQKRLWTKLLQTKRSKTHYFMNQEGRATLRNLGEVLTVYRGYSRKHQNKNGLSWTLDKKVAEAHSKARKGNKPAVVKRTVLKSEIFAYVPRSGNEEVILVPKNTKGRIKRVHK